MSNAVQTINVQEARGSGASRSGTLQQERIVKLVLQWSVLGTALVIVIFPLYWMLLTAFDPPTLSYSAKISLLPKRITLDAFAQLIREYPFMLWMWNSAAVSMITTLLAVVVGTMAAYSLARLRYPGRGFLAGTFFLAYIFPATLLVVPVFVILSVLGLTDDYFGLVLSYLIFTVPFCTWMLRAYLTSIPRELEEAALVDGATRVQAMVLIILPLAAPGVAAATIFAFTLSWNEYLYAFILMNDSTKMTLSPGMTKLVFGDIFLWGMIMAGATLMSMPVVLLYFVAQRFVVSGLTAGSVKG
ncbi:MAG: carbohydrate ABC transporter permease [Chloroflexi bacterium]|nr:carbohydrate ABC transporter permease [Chloroflexota bacterium]